MQNSNNINNCWNSEHYLDMHLPQHCKCFPVISHNKTSPSQQQMLQSLILQFLKLSKLKKHELCCLSYMQKETIGHISQQPQVYISMNSLGGRHHLQRFGEILSTIDLVSLTLFLSMFFRGLGSAPPPLFVSHSLFIKF